MSYAGCIYLPGACDELKSDTNSQLAQGIKYSRSKDISEGLRAEGIASYDLVIVLELSVSPLLRRISEEVRILLSFGVYPLTQSRELGLEIPKEVEMNLRHPRSYIAARRKCSVELYHRKNIYSVVCMYRIRVCLHIPHIHFVDIDLDMPIYRMYRRYSGVYEVTEMLRSLR